MGAEFHYDGITIAQALEPWGIVFPLGPGNLDTMYDSRDQARYIADSPAVKQYVEDTYQRTQAELKATEIDRVTLSRGMVFSPSTMPEELKVSNPSVVTSLAPLSSFSTSGKDRR